MNSYDGFNGCEECICSKCSDISCDYCCGDPERDQCSKCECPYDE